MSLRVSIDTNVLVYALLEPDSPNGATAQAIVAARSIDMTLPVQVAAETLAVTRRKRPDLEDDARERVLALLRMHQPVETSLAVLTRAVDLSRRYGFQIYDSVILAASLQGGAEMLLSEDMQDGQRVAGLRILNPFAPGNQAEVAALLA